MNSHVSKDNLAVARRVMREWQRQAAGGLARQHVGAVENSVGEVLRHVAEYEGSAIIEGETIHIGTGVSTGLMKNFASSGRVK
jgi:hypothetical protein